jgi:ankyrin repeat protein
LVFCWVNPKIRETINVVGLSKTIPDLNHKSVAQVLVECRKGCQLLAQDQVLREACEKIIGRDIYHDYMRKYHDDKYYQHTGLYAKKVSPIIKSFLRLVALGNVKEVINVLSGYKYLHRELLTARLAVKNKNGEYVYGSALEIARANIDIHHFEQGAKLIDELVACIQRLELPIQHQIMQEVEQDGYLDRVKDLMARHFPANFKELKDKESVNYERALSDAYNKHYRNLPVRTVQAFIAIHEGNILSLKNDVMLTFKDLEELRNASGLLLIDSAFYDDQQVVLDYLFSIVLHQYNISSKEELDALTAKNQPHILHYAVLFNQSSEVMEALIRSFGNVDAVLNQSSTPLHLAVRHGRVQHAHTLINHGANINALTYQNISVLHLAINSGSLEMVDLLLKHHAETDTICKGEGYAALHRVVIRGDIQLIELLLDHGVNVNAVTASGETALHIAAGKLDFHGIIKILLERGANLHLTTPKDHCTPFKIAMSAKNYRNALVLYAHELFERPDYHFQNTLTFFGETLIEFGHSADVKKKALRAFIDVMEGQADMETLMQYEDALNNGRLGKIVKGLGYEVSAKSVKPGYRNLISF